MQILHRRSGFTLVEMIVATAIFALIMTSIFIVYEQTVTANRELSAARALQTAARDVTDTIAKDIRDYGINTVGMTSSLTAPNIIFSGAEELKVQGNISYFNAENSLSSTVECGRNGALGQTGACFVLRRKNIGTVPEDTPLTNSGNVRVESLFFDIVPSQESDGITLGREWLVRIRMTLKLVNTVGLRSEASSRLSLQTTISEKIYKN